MLLLRFPTPFILRCTLFIWLFLWHSALSFGQSKKIFHETFTQQDGLLLDDVQTMCFDDDGFLWLGGSNQDARAIIASDQKLVLQRFNGKTFHNISLPDFDVPLIQTEQLFKRNDGQFYVLVQLTGSYRLLLFNPITTTFKTIEFKDNPESLSSVYSYENKNYILTQKEKTITLQELSDDLTLKPIFSFRDATKERYFIDGSTQFIPYKDYCIISDDNLPIQFLDWKGNTIKHNLDASLIAQKNQSASRYSIDEFLHYNGKLYAFIQNNPKLYTHNNQTKTFKIADNPTINLPSDHLKVVTDANGNQLTLASQKNSLGFYELNATGFQTKHQIELDNITGIAAISKNLNKELWFTTNGALHYLKFPSTKVTTFLDSLSLRAIKPLDSKNYLVATENKGWFTVNTETKTAKPYLVYENGNVFEPRYSTNIFIEDSVIWSSSRACILKVNQKTREATLFKHYPIICLERPNDSTIIYGTRGYYLMKFNTKTETHSPLLKTDSLYIYDLEIKNNLVVAGTDKGLLTYHLQTKEHTFYGKEQLEDPFILMTDYHKDFGFLAGTRSGHIVAFDAKTKNFKTIYKDDLKAGIATITFDDSTWWINTFNGVVAFDTKSGNKTRFSEKDGFSHYEGNRYSSLKTVDGIFTGSISGLNYFNPKDLKIQQDSAALTLLKIRKYNSQTQQIETQFDRSLLKANSIILPAENTMLELDFGLKNVNAVNTNASYKYRLNQQDWIDLRHQNRIQFPNLASGNYLLEIEAFDYSGKKIANPLAIEIISKNFFYKTWWFILLIILTVVGFLMWRLKQLQTRKKLQEQFAYGLIQSQENERKRIAKELHDSINQQLTLIKKKAQNSQQTEITELTHNTLEEVRAISRGLYPPLLKQLGLTESIKQLIVDLDEEHELFFSEEIDEIDTYFDEDETLNFYRFIQECITNVLKHANAKAVAISIEKINQEIIATIRDNGKGFEISEQKKQNSLGLKTIAERIKIMKGSLHINSELKKGTTIKAIIPIQYGN